MMDWKNKKVFITGASGFIGRHLARALDSLDADLGFFVHTNDAPHLGKRHYGDLRKDDPNLYHFLHGFKPEVVFHLAAQPIVCEKHVDEMETLEVNLNGTANILHACKDLPSLKSFVHISTDKVYGNISPITKDTVPNGTGHPYNVSKLAADYLAQMYSNFYGIPMVIIRNANVYGSGDKHFDRIVPRTIQKIHCGERPVIRGDGTNTRDYLHVSDVVDGYLKAAELPYKENLSILNLGGFNHSVLDVIDTILAEMRHVDIRPIFEKQWQGEIPHQHIWNDQNLIDWKPKVDLETGLSMTVAWYKDYLDEHS